MKIQTKAIHVGDRKKAGPFVPVTTPIYTASSFTYDSVATLDRVLGREEPGFSYARYDSPTAAALEEVITELESGAGTLTCSSGMAAVYAAINTALIDRRRNVIAATGLYGATVGMLMNLLEPTGVHVRFVDVCNLDALRAAVAEEKPGCILIESISNPLLRVGEIDKIADIARDAGAALIVDNTFATPLILRPLELGANFVVHSLTKYLAGHGDLMGGAVVSDEAHLQQLRAYGRVVGPLLGPFECYLAMRGIKTFPLRMERHCSNACRVASWMATHPKVEKVHFPADPSHPDAAAIKRLLAPNLYGAIISFEIKDANKSEVFRFMDALKMVVRGTSLGDVHTMTLYPAISSHRDIAPRQRERMGIRENLVRLSIGIEDVDDIIADLDQAL
jgi:cystathionine beta-lyase/cystathionine gamma-synthase